MALSTPDPDPIMRIWRITVDEKDWLFDDLDMGIAFLRAEMSLGAKGGTVASEWMAASIYQALVDKEEEGD